MKRGEKRYIDINWRACTCRYAQVALITSQPHDKEIPFYSTADRQSLSVRCLFITNMDAETAIRCGR